MAGNLVGTTLNAFHPSSDRNHSLTVGRQSLCSALGDDEPISLLPLTLPRPWFFSMYTSNGAPLDASTAGGVSDKRAKLLNRPPRPSERPEDFLVNLLDDISFMKLINLDGYILMTHGRETMRQMLMIVASDSMIVQIVAGMI